MDKNLLRKVGFFSHSVKTCFPYESFDFKRIEIVVAPFFLAKLVLNFEWGFKDMEGSRIMG